MLWEAMKIDPLLSDVLKAAHVLQPREIRQVLVQTRQTPTKNFRPLHQLAICILVVVPRSIGRTGCRRHAYNRKCRAAAEVTPRGCACSA